MAHPLACGTLLIVLLVTAGGAAAAPALDPGTGEVVHMPALQHEAAAGATADAGDPNPRGPDLGAAHRRYVDRHRYARAHVGGPGLLFILRE
jgi:hypothetical protein